MQDNEYQKEGVAERQAVMTEGCKVRSSRRNGGVIELTRTIARSDLGVCVKAKVAGR